MVDNVVAKGNKNKGSVLSTKDEWKEICKELSIGWERDIAQQLKNKLTPLRSRYKICQNLMKDATGIGSGHIFGTSTQAINGGTKRYM